MTVVWAKRFIWAAIATVVGVMWGEGITRVLYPQNVDTVLDILQEDPVLGFMYRPLSSAMERGRDYNVPFDINSLGLRDQELGAKNDRFRVLLLGNSFAVSHGCSLSESLAAALESELNKELELAGIGKRIEVINAANAGYNSFNYWRGFRKWNDLLEPDMVVVGFVPSIEHKCDPEDVRFVIREGLLVSRYREGEAPHIPNLGMGTRVRKSLARNSEMYVLLRNFLYYNEKTDRMFRREGVQNANPRHLAPYVDQLSDKTQAGVERAYSYMRKLRDETREAGVGFAIISIPERTQVQDGYFEALKNGSDPALKLDREKPGRMLREFCEKNEMLLFEPLDAIKAEDRHQPTYFTLDNHWNPTGIGVASRDVADRWRQMGLAPFGDTTDPSQPENQ